MLHGALATHYVLGFGDPGEVRPLVARVLTGAQPNAGVTFKHTVPGNQWERLVGVTFKLATSAVVATRVPIVQFKDGDGNEFLTVTSPGTVAAGANQTVSFGIGVVAGQATQNARVCMSLPDMMLYPGLSWTLNATGLDVGDQLSAIVFYVQEYEAGTGSGVNLGRKELLADGTVREWR